MYAPGKEFSLAIRAKIYIGSTIRIQEKYILSKIYLWIQSTYIIKKLLMIGITYKMIEQKPIVVSLLMQAILIT